MGLLNPLVTVLMPIYNGEKYLVEAIESVLKQLFTNFELLILNDDSTDNSLNIIKSFNDGRINLVENNHNIGLTATLNEGIKLARGKYIARLDQDDLMKRERLSLQIKYLENHNNIILLGSGVEYIDHEGDLLYKQEMPIHHKEIENHFTIGNPFVHSSVIFDKKSVMDISGYNGKFIYAQDYDLWLRLSLVGKVHNLPNLLTINRIHNNQETTNSEIHDIQIKEKIIIIKQIIIHNNTNKKAKATGYMKLSILYLIRKDYKFFFYYLLKVGKNFPYIIISAKTYQLIKNYYKNKMYMRRALKKQNEGSY